MYVLTNRRIWKQYNMEVDKINNKNDVDRYLKLTISRENVGRYCVRCMRGRGGR